MTYVSEQTSRELRDHMKRITAMHGWNEPLSARLWREVQDQDLDLWRLRAFARFIEQAVARPVTSYSVCELDDLFGLVRDRIAGLREAETLHIEENAATAAD